MPQNNPATDTLKTSINQSKRAQSMLTGVPEEIAVDGIKGAGAQEAMRIASQFGLGSTSPTTDLLRATAPKAQETPTPKQQPVAPTPTPLRDRDLEKGNAPKATPGVLSESNIATLRELEAAGIDTSKLFGDKSGGKKPATQESQGERPSGAATQGETNPVRRQAQEHLSEYFDSAEFQLVEEQYGLDNITSSADAARAKQELDAKFQSDKNALEEDLAANGLAFSGLRATAVRALEENLAASALDEDRKLAQALLQADINFRDTVLKGVTQLVKDAKENDKTALAQLNKAGFAMVNGQLVPTIEAVREQRIAESNDVRVVINDQGSVTGLDKVTGEILWTTPRVGRSGSATPNLLVSPIADPITGNVSYVQTIDKDTGNVVYRDASTGQEVDPSQVQIDDGKEQTEVLVDYLMGDLNLDDIFNSATEPAK